MTPDKLLSSNAQEVYSQWASGTTYAKHDRVIYQTSIYESLINNNTGNNPATSTTQWLRIAPTNTCAMFDSSVTTQTVSSTPLIVEVTPNQVFNSVALLNMEATDILVEVIVDSVVVYSRAVNLDQSPINDWYMYFFEPISYRRDIVLTDIPPFATGILKVTITSGGDVKIGSLLFGTVYEIGDTQYGVGLGIRDYSVKSTDVFGNTVLLRRNFSKRMSPTVFIKNVQLPFITNLLSELRAEPTVFIGSEEAQFEPLIVYGYMRDWGVVVPYPQDSLLQLEIEGLT